MKKIPKLIICLCLLVFSTFVSYKFAFYIAEKYYFDKIFYRKSTIFGYTNDMANLPTKDTDRRIKERVKDLIALVEASHAGTQVLGIKDDGKYHVAIIGDSFTYGSGIRISDRFSNVLENKLNEIRPTKVYNFALPGDSIVDNYAKFLLIKKQYKIDFYVIATVNNDLIFDTHNKYPGEQEIFDELQTLCPGTEFKYRFSDNDSYEEYMKNAIAPSLSPEYANICYGKEISKRMTGPNVAYMITSMDLDYSKGARSVLHSPTITDLFEAFIKEHSICLNPFVSTGMKYTAVSPGEGHPSAETHKGYADFLFKYITGNKNLGFSQ